MGLDMYLTARKTDESVRDILARNSDLLDGFPDYNGYDTISVSVPIYQWRKANAIHKWFVDNCADGEDNCQPVYVSRGNLDELYGAILAAQVDKESAEENLPTESGCFFGSYEYDEYYFEELKNTREMLEAILKNDKFLEWDFEYQASW